MEQMSPGEDFGAVFQIKSKDKEMVLNKKNKTKFMKKMLSIHLLAVILLISACGGNVNTGESEASSSETAQAELQAEVMAIHDEVMPKMSEMNRIARNLRTYLEEHPDLPLEQKEPIEAAIASLDEAGEAMMDWMAAYGDLTRSFKEMEHDAIMQALEKEKEEISEVRDAMLSGMETGEQLSATLDAGE